MKRAFFLYPLIRFARKMPNRFGPNNVDKGIEINEFNYKSPLIKRRAYQSQVLDKCYLGTRRQGLIK